MGVFLESTAVILCLISVLTRPLLSVLSVANMRWQICEKLFHFNQQGLEVCTANTQYLQRGRVVFGDEAYEQQNHRRVGVRE